MPETRRIILLGSTGSIGTQTIEVVKHLNAQRDPASGLPRFEVVGLATGRNAKAMLEQARALGVRELAIADADAAAPPGARLRAGPDAAERLVREVEADVVVGAMVGFAGLPATLAAVELGRDVALANKETLVAAGSLVVAEARRSGAKLLPVDSEHSGVWQCLLARSGVNADPPIHIGSGVSKVILTASGGALRDKPLAEVYNATVEQALAHPTWSMGAKVTIDSASLTNKALEVIEAHWLFGLEADQIGVLVHPQSIVHALVEYADGSVMAQLGSPDMRTPIHYALVHPRRTGSVSKPLDFTALRRLDFSPPDTERFPALKLGFEVIRAGGASGAVFNGANEAAVEAFIQRRIPFGRIAELSAAAMDALGAPPLASLQDAIDADREARAFVTESITAGHRVQTKGPPQRLKEHRGVGSA